MCVYSSASTNVIVDITGWFSPDAADGMSASAPRRLADTRCRSRRIWCDSRPAACSRSRPATPGRVGRGAERHRGRGRRGRLPDGVPMCHAAASCIDGELRAGRGPARTTRSSAVAPGGLVCVYSSAAVDVVVDMTAVFSPSGRTRIPAGRPAAPRRHPARTAWSRQAARSRSRVPSPGATARAVSVNVTATGHDADGFSTAFGCGTNGARSVDVEPARRRSRTQTARSCHRRRLRRDACSRRRRRT